MDKTNTAFELAEQIASLLVDYHLDDLRAKSKEEIKEIITLRSYPLIATALVTGENIAMREMLRREAQ